MITLGHVQYPPLSLHQPLLQRWNQVLRTRVRLRTTMTCVHPCMILYLLKRTKRLHLLCKTSFFDMEQNISLHLQCQPITATDSAILACSKQIWLKQPPSQSTSLPIIYALRRIWKKVRTDCPTCMTLCGPEFLNDPDCPWMTLNDPYFSNSAWKDGDHYPVHSVSLRIHIWLYE